MFFLGYGLRSWGHLRPIFSNYFFYSNLVSDIFTFLYTLVIIWMQKTSIWYLCTYVFSILLIISHLLHKTLSTFFEAVSLKLAYFAPPNGLGQSFRVNCNYLRCLEYFNMISFVLTSWVISWWQILLVFSRYAPSNFINFFGADWKCFCMLKLNHSISFIITKCGKFTIKRN